MSRTPNPTRFQKTLGLNDFYFGTNDAANDAADDWPYPLGHIQMVGKSDGAQIRGEGTAGLPAVVPRQAVRLDGATLSSTSG